MKYESFEEAKRTYLSETCDSIWKYNKIQGTSLHGLHMVREITDPAKEVSYKQIFQDLYVSYLEDIGDNREYWIQLQEAREHLQSFSDDELETFINEIFSYKRSLRNKGMCIWEQRLGFKSPQPEEEEIIICSKPKKVETRGGKGISKTKYQYLLPDGTVRWLTPSGVARHYTSKGISLIRLDE